MGAGAFKNKKNNYAPSPQEAGADDAQVSGSAQSPNAAPSATMQVAAGHSQATGSTASPVATTAAAESPDAPTSQQQQLQKSNIRHLEALPTKALKKLAMSLDATTTRRCAERRDLVDVVLSKLSPEKANRQAFEHRTDVREALALQAMLHRMLAEARSLLAAAQERREYAEACLFITPSEDVDLSVTEQHKKTLKAAVESATGQMLALESAIQNIESEGATLCAGIEAAYESSNNELLDKVKEMTDRAMTLLAGLSPAAETLGDFRSWQQQPSTAASGSNPTTTAAAAASSSPQMMMMTPPGSPPVHEAEVTGPMDEDLPTSASALGDRSQKLAEVEQILSSHNMGAQTPRRKAEEEQRRKQADEERLRREAEWQRLEAEKDDLMDKLSAELAGLDDETLLTEEAERRKLLAELEKLLAEPEPLGAEVDQKLHDMSRVLDCVEEERHTQVDEVRRRHQQLELNTMALEKTAKSQPSQPSAVPVSENLGPTCLIGPDDIEYGPDGYLGAGACGVVMKAVLKRTRQPVAVKTITLDSGSKRGQLVSEIEGLIQAQGCPFLVQWFGRFEAVTSPSVHVVLEYMDLGSLSALKSKRKGQRLDAKWSWHIAKQVVGGLNFLHEKRLLHRDVKPGNILHNTAGEVKLTDFGISKVMNVSLAAGTYVGTSNYMSPERCLNEEYGFSSDIWSAGMVFHEMANGEHPFEKCQSFMALFDALCEQPEPRLSEEHHPPELCHFVASCLLRDVSRRFNCQSLQNHPFLAQDMGPREDFADWLATLD